MKKEQKQEWEANTVYITPPFPAFIVYDCREGCGVIIGMTAEKGTETRMGC